MGDLFKYEPSPVPNGNPTTGGERGTAPTNKMGTPLNVTVYRYWVAITPSATPLAFIPDALVVTADATVTMAPADSPADLAVAIPLKAGVFSPYCPAVVTAVSTGTCYALYTRKPS